MSTYGDKKLENINIFYDTMRAIKVDTQLSLAVRDSLKNQKVILEEQSVPVPEKRYGRTDTVVSGKKTLEAAREYKNEKVCVLNFASATNPGGGVEKGSSAQEECICRCSTLYPCLASVTTRELFYVPHRKEKNPLYNDDIVYTPGVVVLKDDRNEARTLSSTERYQVDVVTAAAPNLRVKPSNYMNPGSGSKPVTISQGELKDLLTNRIRRVFSVCAEIGRIMKGRKL